MRIINRVFIAGLVAFAALWIAAYVVDIEQRDEDRRFYNERIAPARTANPQHFDTQVLSESLQRSQRRAENAWFRTIVMMTGMAWVMGWSLLQAVQNELFWKRRNAAHRPADPSAGAIVREASNQAGPLTARTMKSGLSLFPRRPRTVEVDFSTRTVVFQGFTFITAFMGNKPVPAVTVPFSEVLGGRIATGQGSQSLYLRTTIGAVAITDDVKPFSPIASVLLDIAEVNRSNATAHAAALAREPKINTPWYGWLIFAAALAGIGVLAMVLWNLG